MPKWLDRTETWSINGREQLLWFTYGIRCDSEAYRCAKMVQKLHVIESKSLGLIAT